MKPQHHAIVLVDKEPSELVLIQRALHEAARMISTTSVRKRLARLLADALRRMTARCLLSEASLKTLGQEVQDLRKEIRKAIPEKATPPTK